MSADDEDDVSDDDNDVSADDVSADEDLSVSPDSVVTSEIQ